MRNHAAQLAIIKQLSRQELHSTAGNCQADEQTLITQQGAINLLEGYGNDNPGAKSQGMKQLMAGGGVALIGITLVPLLSGLFG